MNWYSISYFFPKRFGWAAIKLTHYIPIFNWDLLAANVEIFCKFLCEVNSCFPSLTELSCFLPKIQWFMIFSNGIFRKSCFWNTLSKAQVREHFSLFISVLLYAVLCSSMPKITSLYFQGWDCRLFTQFKNVYPDYIMYHSTFKNSFVQPHD